MYKVVKHVPTKWSVFKHGDPLIVLEDEYGGQSVIAIDDHCLVLYNGSEDREFVSVNHWYKEAILAITEFINNNPDYVSNWYTLVKVRFPPPPPID